MSASDDVCFVDAWTPLCFIADDDQSHGRYVSLALQRYGIETALFSKAYALREALSRRTPDLVLLDVPPDPTDAFEQLRALAERSYRGPIQLMSSGEPAAIDALMRLGVRSGLRIMPVLQKPIDQAGIRKLVREHRLDGLPASSGQTSLDEALRNNWVEFWYQPKINLRKKQLAGIEVFARVRHPQHGVLLPAAFMEDATEKSLVELTEKSVIHALEAGVSFSKIGIKFQLAVNVSMSALIKLPIRSMVGEYRPENGTWPSLILDVSEDQIASDPTLSREFSGHVRSCGIKLAIDDFGRGYLPLARLNEIAFTELKLDRSFVADCTTNKNQAALCKSVIDLAHNFDATAVAVGVEKALDAHNLFRLGCDLGQGYLFAQPMNQARFLKLLQQRAEMARARSAGATSTARPAAPAELASIVG